MKKKAFTLAEVLTTLVIIGVVAAITAPVLQATISEHILEKQQSVFERKFDQNMHMMQLKGELAKPYATTMDFVKAMQKYMNITKVCDKEHLTECFAPAIMMNKKEVKYDVSQLRLASDVDIEFSDTYDSDLVGIVFADGVNAIISQDPKCIVSDKYNQVADVSYCMGMIYDINGTEGPNIYKKDILGLNVGSKSIQIGTPFVPDPLSIEECETAKRAGAPINYCNQNNDYWAGAAAKCFEEGGYLPTTLDLKKLADRVYDVNVPQISTVHTKVSVKDTDLWQQLQRPDAGNYFWSSEEYSDTYAYLRYFSATTTCGEPFYGGYGYHGGYRTNGSYRAFCLSDEDD